MKKIVFIVFLSLCGHAFAACNIDNYDVNSKYQFADLIFSSLGVIDRDEKDINTAIKDSQKNPSLVGMIVALKQENIDFMCMQSKLNSFNSSDKETIKNALINAEDYLNRKINWNKKLLSTFEFNNQTLSQTNNAFADLKLEQKEIDEKLSGFAIAPLIAISIEQSDLPNMDISSQSKEQLYYKLGITQKERNQLITRLSSLANTENDQILLMLGIAVADKLKNKKIQTLDVLRSQKMKLLSQL